MSKWTEKVVCESNAEAKVKKDEFQRKGMISRIRRNPARYQGGTPMDGTWIVQARTPKNGLNTYMTNEVPLRLVNWPIVITTLERTKKGKDWKDKWVYEETEIMTAGVQIKAVRLSESEVAEAVKTQQEVVNKKVGN